MQDAFLNFLRCPFCGTRVSTVENQAPVRAGSCIESGVLGCECCTFPIVAGIPVLIADDITRNAIDALEADRRDEALLMLLALEGKGTRADAFRALLARGTTDVSGRACDSQSGRGSHVFRASVLGSHIRDGRGTPAGNRAAAMEYRAPC